ncbi:MAG: ribokinase [Alphaproteobacteria bacterium]
MILVFGSLNMDLVFRVPVLPAPGQTVLTPTYARACGGKGANQAVAAARLGATVRMAGRVGRDEHGDILLEALAADAIDAGAVLPGQAATGVAIVAVDSRGENLILVASGANLEARGEQVPDEWLDRATTVVMQLEVPYAETFALGRRARARGARVVLNAAPAGPVEPEGCDVLVVNEGEASALAKLAGLRVRGATAAAKALARAWDRLVVVTLGSKGARAFAPDRTWAVDAPKIEPVDTTGAGDAFVGALAAALDAGRDVGEALRHGAAAGACACLVEGAQPSLPRARQHTAMLDRVPPARTSRGGG